MRHTQPHFIRFRRIKQRQRQTDTLLYSTRFLADHVSVDRPAIYNYITHVPNLMIRQSESRVRVKREFRPYFPQFLLLLLLLYSRCLVTYISRASSRVDNGSDAKTNYRSTHFNQTPRRARISLWRIFRTRVVVAAAAATAVAFAKITADKSYFVAERNECRVVIGKRNIRHIGGPTGFPVITHPRGPSSGHLLDDWF